MHLQSGEQIKIIDLIHGLLIGSANDAAWALEDSIGKDKLVGLMNDKVKWLGLSDTHYVDAAGYDAGSQSSVHDLAIISSYALKKKTVRQDATTKLLTVSSVDGKISHN